MSSFLFYFKSFLLFGVIFIPDYHGGSGRFGSDPTTPLIGHQPQHCFVLNDETITLLEGDRKLLAKEHLTLGDFVGKGNFGSVYKARLYRTTTDELEEVAVKTLKTEESCMYFNAFLVFFAKNVSLCLLQSFLRPSSTNSLTKPL